MLWASTIWVTLGYIERIIFLYQRHVLYRWDGRGSHTRGHKLWVWIPKTAHAHLRVKNHVDSKKVPFFSKPFSTSLEQLVNTTVFYVSCKFCTQLPRKIPPMIIKSKLSFCIFDLTFELLIEGIWELITSNNYYIIVASRRLDILYTIYQCTK